MQTGEHFEKVGLPDRLEGATNVIAVENQQNLSLLTGCSPHVRTEKEFPEHKSHVGT
jgi:hypothetical protein